MAQLKIIVAAAEADDREEAIRLLAGEQLEIVGSLAADSSGLAKAGRLNADILVLYSDHLSRQERDFVERIYMTRPTLLILLLCTETDADLLNRAMACGVSRVIELTRPDEELIPALLAAWQREKNRLAAGSADNTVGYESRVLSFFGSKGGVGKTTLAVNTAIALARLNKRVVLLDLDLQFGDVGVFLDIAKCDTIVDVVEENDYTYPALSSFLFKHYSGVAVLSAPPGPEYAELIKADQVTRIIDGLAGEFDYILLDLPPAFTDISLAALGCSGEIYFVLNPDISSLRNAQLSFNIFDSLNLRDRLRLILNRDGAASLRQRDIEEVLELPALLVLGGDDKSCRQAVNRGVPLVLGNPRCRLSQQLTSFAAALVKAGGAAAPAAKKRGWRKK